MVQLFESGAYLIDGKELIADNADAAVQVAAKTGRTISKEEAAKQTMAYKILQAHNTSGDDEHLKVKFDRLTSHDITFVGIIQTARASGLEKFPVPYVLTNCHNSLCAVGGTINEDDHMFGLSCAFSSYSSVCKRNACRLRQDDSWFRQPYTLWCTWNNGMW